MGEAIRVNEYVNGLITNEETTAVEMATIRCSQGTFKVFGFFDVANPGPYPRQLLRSDIHFSEL